MFTLVKTLELMPVSHGNISIVCASVRFAERYEGDIEHVKCIQCDERILTDFFGVVNWILSIAFL